METKIQKWGNSLGVRLPKSIATGQELEAGSVVKLSLLDKKIIIERVSKSTPTIKDLVSQITNSNLHAVVDWGKPRGKEIW